MKIALLCVLYALTLYIFSVQIAAGILLFTVTFATQMVFEAYGK